jgi:hypothetical protein
MMKNFNRRDFVKTAAIGGLGLGLTTRPGFSVSSQNWIHRTVWLLQKQ